MVKCSEINNLKEEGLVLAHTVRMKHVTMGKSQWQGLGIHSQKAEIDECTLVFSSFLHFIQSRMEWSLLQTKMALPTSISIFKMTSHRHAQRPFFLVILDSAKLTVNPVMTVTV